jgi:hypothetical protein
MNDEIPEPLKVQLSFWITQATRTRLHWNFPQYIVDNLRQYHPKNPTKMLKPKRCFNNAIEVCSGLRTIPQEPTRRVRGAYIEGWLIFGGYLPLVHAWNSWGQQAYDYTAVVNPNDEYTSWWGIEIPTDVLLLALSHPKLWSQSSGVIETIFRLPEKDFLKTRTMFNKEITQNDPARQL